MNATNQPPIRGLHHVTAMASDAQANVDFYTGVLGLRLVKVTVNFDDPSSYHLYYGDAAGQPGTILTFFVWPGAGPGRIGAPQVSTTAFRVAAGTLPAWVEHLAQHGVPHAGIADRGGQQVLAATDRDGMQVELVDAGRPGPSPVGARLAVERIGGVTLSLSAADPTTRFLTDEFQARPGEPPTGDRARFHVGHGDAAAVVDLLATPDAPRGRLGAGIVHHVAWRVADDAGETAWLDALRTAGHGVSPVMDRTYFHSIYFREPGGVLFEIATDNPGFAVDEPGAELGTHLCLPPWLQPRRAEIEASLPPLRTPAGTVIGRRG
jgi:glyoxalase family protein